ncbi:MAG: hypothetical protein KGI66_04970, partial [Patescibacteria group bacterium]|nr:hypothetical protein [Patescibacteria group bacterium]
LACRLAGKRYIIRTGGDFLYESHVERTGEKALFKDFYETKRPLFSMKERVVFRATRAVLKGAAAVIFSTEWQKDIFEKVYGLDRKKSFIVENFCGERLPPLPAGGMPENRAFVAGTRVLKWKNIDALRESFADARVAIARRGLPDIELDTSKAVYEGFVEKVRCSYAVILASLGDISPNMIFDAIRAGTPFILTKETGIAGRVAGCALFVDPLSNRDIAEKIVWLSDPANRAAQAAKVRAFGWVHSWEDIGREIIDIWKKAGKPKRIGKGGSDNSHA